MMTKASSLTATSLDSEEAVDSLWTRVVRLIAVLMPLLKIFNRLRALANALRRRGMLAPKYLRWCGEMLRYGGSRPKAHDGTSKTSRTVLYKVEVGKMMGKY